MQPSPEHTWNVRIRRCYGSGYFHYTEHKVRAPQLHEIIEKSRKQKSEDKEPPKRREPKIPSAFRKEIHCPACIKISSINKTNVSGQKIAGSLIERRLIRPYDARDELSPASVSRRR